MFTDDFLKAIDIKGMDTNEVDAAGLKIGTKSFSIYPAVYKDNEYSYYIVVDYFNYLGKDNKYKDNLNSRELVLLVTMSSPGKISGLSYFVANQENESPDMDYLNNYN